MLTSPQKIQKSVDETEMEFAISEDKARGGTNLTAMVYVDPPGWSPYINNLECGPHGPSQMIAQLRCGQFGQAAVLFASEKGAVIGIVPGNEEDVDNLLGKEGLMEEYVSTISNGEAVRGYIFWLCHTEGPNKKLKNRLEAFVVKHAKNQVTKTFIHQCSEKEKATIYVEYYNKVKQNRDPIIRFRGVELQEWELETELETEEEPEEPKKE